ncbi:MAG: cysteine hydrolase [Paramuribaculum sp.]|nr:cysteine hydrolase [Paramuribaculum sp.]
MTSENKNKIGGMLTNAENVILVIDMENDFVLPDSPMKVAGAYATLPAIKKFLDYGRSKDWAVIYIYRIPRRAGGEAELFRKHYFEEGHPFCIAGTKGAAIPDEIAPQPGDITVTKQRFSAFFGTDLDIILRGLGAKNVYLTGTQYPNCVRSTAVDSMSLDYNTVVVTDCCSAATEEVAKANIYDMQNMGISCVPSSQIMQ